MEMNFVFHLCGDPQFKIFSFPWPRLPLNCVPVTQRAMDYDWDVFLSYLHERPSGIWVNEHFLPYFKFDLGNALNRRARIFIDREGIHSGQKWPARIKHALARS